MSANLWRIDGGRLDLDLHTGQTRAWQSSRRFVFVLAGTQSGKTAFGPWWLWREIRGRGAGDYLAVTASYDLFKLKMLPELRLVFESLVGWRADGPAMGRYWSGERVIELRDPETNEFHAKRADDPMWGRIILRSAESKGGLEAATAKAAWLDECGQDSFTLESWEAVQRRLSLAQGRVLGTTTPYNLGWVKSEIYDAWVGGDSLIDVVQFASYINPSFPREEFDRMADTLPDWRFNMFYRGRFAKPPGLIYAIFRNQPATEGGHLVRPFAIPAEWPRAVAVDFGGANVAILWFALDPSTGIWYLYRDWLGGGDTTAAYVARARDGVEGCVAGAFAVGGAASESQERRDWHAAGIPVLEPPVSAVEIGISRGIGLVKKGRLRIFESCRGTRDELGSYRRKLDDAGEPTEEIIDKRKFHRLDAYRYFASLVMDPALAGQALADAEQRGRQTFPRVSVGY